MSPKRFARNGILLGVLVSLTLFCAGAWAQDAKSEIVVGQTNPYSGPASMWSINGKADAAFFQMLNDNGGINGRKLRLISYDDAYSPPKTVEQTRKLVESDDVLFIYKSLGTAPNAAVAPYLNRKRVPQLLIASGSSRWNDPQLLPWTMSAMLDYRTEARLYASYLLKEKPAAKIAVLYQNDDMGKDFLAGLVSGLGGAGKTMILSAVPYEVIDPTIDSQVTNLRATNADTLFLFTAGKQSVQALKKIAELGWTPDVFIASFSSSVGQTLKVVGFDKAKGVKTAQVYKDPSDPQWQSDPEMARYFSWTDRYLPSADRSDFVNVAAYSIGSLLKSILEKAGDDLSRENIMAKATSLSNERIVLTLPGIVASTSSSDHRPIKQARLVRFDGEQYVSVSDVIGDASQ